MYSNGEWVARVDQLAGEWRQTREFVAAALADTVSPQALSPAEVDLLLRVRRPTEAFAVWRRDHLGEAAGGPDSRLSALFRAVYCDAPAPRFVLMQMIAQHARLLSPAADSTLAHEMLDIYSPVAQMLGLYRFRRNWIEQSVYILKRRDYNSMAARLGIPITNPTYDVLGDVLMAQQLRPEVEHAERLPAVNGLPLSLDERDRIFARLRHDLRDPLRREFGDDAPEIELIHALPGLSVLWNEAPAIIDRPQLAVRIVCGSDGPGDVGDCYRALGIIHGIAEPIGSDHAPGLRDYIARPQFNGFRALQTVCLWPLSEHKSKRRLIKFRILTREMHELNESGLIAPVAASPGHRRHVRAWWNRLNTLARDLGRRSGGRDESIAAYLSRHPLGSRSDPLYCFTPQGQIIWLDDGSLPLDFAYRVHSQLVGQAGGIEVNGRSVESDVPLKNGDLIKIALDPQASRLDFTWQNLVKNHRARGRIRGILRRRAERIHPGRGLFEKEVIRRLDLYRQDQARKRKIASYVPPTPTTAAIERFLERASLGRRLPDINALYDAMAVDPAFVRELANGLIAEYVFPDLEKTDVGRLLLQGGLPVELCSACRPTPVDKLRRRIHRRPQGDTWIIHTDNCRLARADEVSIDPRHVRGSMPDRWPLFRFEISAPDSYRLLGRMLDQVYQLPNSYIFWAEARATREGSAVIELDVAVMQPQLCVDLKNMIESMGESTHVTFRPQPGDPRGARHAADDLSREINNPFTESEVTDGRFIDREEIINAILCWIDEPMSPLLLLHGQRRVGKSSLALRLMDILGSAGRAAPVVPVYIDFRAPSLMRPESTAALIAQEVYLKLKLPIPRLRPGEDPIVWLSGLLGEATQRIGKARFLLIIDEFDADLEAARLRVQPPVLAGLRAIQRTRPEILWLLVVQDIFLADPAFRAALPDVPIEVPQLAVRHLAGPYARVLIEKPAAERHFAYQAAGPDRDDIPAQIIGWTAGNPYLIHIICRKLMDRARHRGRKLITQGDLDLVMNQVLDQSGEQLSHFTDHLPVGGPRRLIAAFVAHSIKPGHRLPLADLVADLEGMGASAGLGAPLRKEDVIAHARFLEQVGIFDMIGGENDASVSIPIRLLHKWIINRPNFGRIAPYDD